MCFKCVLRAVLAEEELAKAGNANPTPVSYDDIDRDHLKAQVNLTNAQAVLRLAEAANSLNMINATAEEQGVLRLITALLPVKPEPIKAESSATSPIRWAEGLIRQLPVDHDGRNSWLLNYGSSIAEAPSKAVDPRENTVGQTDQSATMANQPLTAVDEFEGLPTMLKDYVLSMRELGVEVEVVRLPL